MSDSYHDSTDPHHHPAWPGLARCAPDAGRLASARARGRQLAADLVVASFLLTPAADVARRLGLARQTVHLWQQPRDRGVALSDLLAGPPTWGRGLLSRALVVLDDQPTPRWSASPQALVARLSTRCAQMASILDRYDIATLSDEQLEQLRRNAGETRREAAEIEQAATVALEQRRQRQQGATR